MPQKKIFGPGRIDTPDGTQASIRLTPTPGGSQVKRVQYVIVVDQVKSATTNVGLALETGPDGRHSLPHSTLIALTPITSTPMVLEGTLDDSTSMVSEYLHPILLIKETTSSSSQWAAIEVYEMRKPF